MSEQANHSDSTASGTAAVLPPPVVIHVSLPSDRTSTGFIMLVAGGKTLAGPFRVLGKADNAMAAKKGNATRDPKQPYGDTPTGEYAGTLATRGKSYGPHGVIEMSRPPAMRLPPRATAGRGCSFIAATSTAKASCVPLTVACGCPTTTWKSS